MKIFLFIFINFMIFANIDIDKINISLEKNFYGKIKLTKIERINGLKKITDENSYPDTNFSYGLRIDTYKNLLKINKNYLDIGIGLGLKESVLFDSQYSNLSYLTPIYFTTLYEHYWKKIHFYEKFNIGYELALNKINNLNNLQGYSNTKINGGFYFGLETGFSYKNLFYGLNYNRSRTKFTANELSERIDLNYGTFSFLIGYSF